MYMAEKIAALEKLRKQLHTVVDGAWAREDMLDAKDALEKAARDSGYASCLEICMVDPSKKGATSPKECFKICQEEAGLGDLYRKIWGK